MRAGFILSEVGIGLRRNLTMTFAVVVTVAISLSLLGIGLLSNSQVRVMKDYWYDKIEVSVYLCGSLSDSPSCAGGIITTQRSWALSAHNWMARRLLGRKRPVRRWQRSKTFRQSL